MPIVKLLGYPVFSRPGEVIDVWGHKFVVQPNGDAYADIHPALVSSEVAVGRVLLVADQPASKIAPPVKGPEIVEPEAVVEKEFDLDKEFPGTAKEYFGCKNLSALNEKLRGLKKPHLVEFCQTRANIATSADMGKSTMVIQACHAVEAVATRRT